jgi:hypothetical protein
VTEACVRPAGAGSRRWGRESFLACLFTRRGHTRDNLTLSLAGAVGCQCVAAPVGRYRAVREGGVVNETMTVHGEYLGHWQRSTGAGTRVESMGGVVGTTIAPRAEREGTCSVSETVGRRWPLTTARTARARRKTRASCGCCKQVSHVGKMSSGTCRVRSRIQVVSSPDYS